jgi:hypothetical protein
MTGGERVAGSPTAADDPEMAALRDLAAEVVLAAPVPRSAAYRPRLEPARRALNMAPVQVLSDLGWDAVSSLRRRPLRTAAVALAGLGAVGVVWFSLVPRDASLELAVSPPTPMGLAPTPPPPPIAVPAAPPAPAPVVAAARPVPAATPSSTPEAAPPEARPPVVQRTASKRVPASLALKSTSADPGAQRRRGRRMDPALTLAGRGKEGKKGSSAPAVRAKIDKSRKVASALDRREMLAGLQAIQPRVKQCYRQHGQAGVANVGIDVASGGKVTKVTVTGPLARTPTAGCVKAAVKTARFQGGGGSFHYPFVLP